MEETKPESEEDRFALESVRQLLKSARDALHQPKRALKKKASCRRIETTTGGFHMSGIKGMTQYSEEVKKQIILENKSGMSVQALSKRYGISQLIM